MKTINEMEITFKALSVNEGFARALVAAFCVQANPSLDEITDIKTAVSEAVTNAVVHAYPLGDGDITIKIKLYSCGVYIDICDNGIGIEDFEKAREPFYTSKPDEERSGMGFTVMESFMDEVELKRNGKNGLIVHMEKIFKGVSEDAVGM
ncbi:MAG: anti-sigma F factor [Clostridia bacterium]|nr:anti-sigma F factor [Clostridia bacterium]